MKRRALVVGHADADGHVIAEQARRNLEVVDAFEVTTVIDPIHTKDHKAWLHLSEIHEIDDSDLVFFVDLMFAPSSFGAEAAALVRFVSDRPTKRFFVVDHHPLPLRLLGAASNLRALYRPDVLDCTIGPSSRMMIVAALCEKQDTRARGMRTPFIDEVARGLRRAAALGGPLPGEKLLSLLRFDRWQELASLGRDDPSEHRLPRGRRPLSQPTPPILAQLDKTATALAKEAAPRHHLTESTMPYDFEAVADHAPPSLTPPPSPQPHDLESVVMILELAAIYLTPSPGTTFTIEQLLDQAREMGGDELEIDEKDVKIVIDKAAFLKKSGKTFALR